MFCLVSFKSVCQSFKLEAVKVLLSVYKDCLLAAHVSLETTLFSTMWLSASLSVPTPAFSPFCQLRCPLSTGFSLASAENFEH